MHADVMQAINVQINSEFTAWYQYLAMAAFCEREKFTGAARWLKQQSLEEYQHGMKLFDFVLARNGVVELTKIEQPTREFESFAEVFESALKQEEGVTAQINSLYELCFQCKAFAEMTELQWFLTEQVEEEKTSREIVARFRLVGDDPVHCSTWTASSARACLRRSSPPPDGLTAPIPPTSMHSCPPRRTGPVRAEAEAPRIGRKALGRRFDAQ